MKLKRNLVLAVLCLSTVTTFGQSEPQSSRIKEPEKITFKPHWFIQAQLGAAHTVGEAKFTDLISRRLLLISVISSLPHSAHVLV